MPRSVRLTSRLPSARARGDGRAGASMLPSHLDGDGRLQGTLGSRHEAIGHLALPPSFQLTYSIVTRRCYLSLKPLRRSRTTVQDPHRPRPASRVDHGEGGAMTTKNSNRDCNDLVRRAGMAVVTGALVLSLIPTGAFAAERDTSSSASSSSQGTTSSSPAPNGGTAPGGAPPPVTMQVPAALAAPTP